MDIKSVHTQLNKHKDAIRNTVESLNEFSSLVCFLRIISCNGDSPCNFSDAWCVAERSVDVDSTGRNPIVYFADLFDVTILTQFLDTGTLPEHKKQSSTALLKSFDRLAKFLDNYEETSKILQKYSEKNLREVEWAGIFGTHIAKQLAVVQDMRMSDTGYEKVSVCICGCGNDLEYGDTSMGNKQVWHGSIDIFLGHVAIDVAWQATDSSSTSAFELDTDNLDKYRHQLIAETIVFSCTRSKGLVPTIAVSREKLKVFLYDHESDLLFESKEFPLASFTKEKELPYQTILALWLAINYSLFGSGISPVYKQAGYFANFKPFITEKKKCEIYVKEMHLFGCKKVLTMLPPLSATVDKKGQKGFWHVPRS
ncbi:uncharacterized protein LOC123522831 [Mercenaria mercenaria]|uniref:uncharacterized protein LOC123522831 n=1 Tax=Mercenaria mercenaria TaxID=6596 RepID=UPI00234FA82B|nr:uncharacterized protein LOC123522831 [Mercenaria mercenaria]